MAIFAILIPLHSLPMVLMSSFPQNGSFHPSPCVQSHRCSMAEAGLLEETSIYKDLDLEKTDSLQMQRNNTTAHSGELCRADSQGTLPAVRRKKQEVNIYYPLPHGTRLTDQLSSFQQIQHLHRQLLIPQIQQKSRKYLSRHPSPTTTHSK